MGTARKSSIERDRNHRGTILLLDDAPVKGVARARQLIRRGFHVVLAATIQQAESLWKPDHYIVVLVSMRKNLRHAVEFCNRIKKKYPQQTIGMLVSQNVELPPTRCPDLLWPEENPDQFLARVETWLISAAPLSRQSAREIRFLGSPA
jgi:CheY-like chemotaxis protein